MTKKGLIIGPCRSGTTMIYRSFSNHPSIQIYNFQSIKEGQRKNSFPDYSFFDTIPEEGKTLIAKETIGHSTIEDCTLQIFPPEAFETAISNVSPVFIFRDPLETYTSWLNNGLVPDGNPNLFITAFKWTYQLYEKVKAVNPKTIAITYDDICENPEIELKKICEIWGILYDSSLLNWNRDFLDSFNLDQQGVNEGHYNRVIESRSIEKKREQSIELSSIDLDKLRISNLQEIYNSLN